MAKLAKKKKGIKEQAVKKQAVSEDNFTKDDQVGMASDGVNQLLKARDDMSVMTGKYRTKLNTALANIYAVALRYRDDLDAWQDFCRNPAWEGYRGKAPRIEDQSDTLRPCLRFAVGFDDANASKTASKYFKALCHPFVSGRPAEEIADYLQKGGGIEKLASAASKSRNGSIAGEEGVRIMLAANERASDLLGYASGSTVKVELSITDTDQASLVHAELLKIKAS